MLPVLSSAVLRSAWVEPDPLVRSAMWQPLLVYLKGTSCPMTASSIFTDAWHRTDHPNAWTLEAESEKEDEESEDEDGDAPKTPPSNPAVSAQATPSQAYTEFLQFLATGCSGSPAQGYPAVLIILSTIPSSVRRISLDCISLAYNLCRLLQPRPCNPWKISSRLSGPLLMHAC